MRVALFTDTYIPDVNGVARTLGRWVDYLQTQGVECKVFAPESLQTDKDSVNLSMVERFVSIPFVLYPECRLAIPNPLNINRVLKEFKPTLIHVATPFNLGLQGIHYAKKYKIPLVASYHTHFDQYLFYYKLQWMETMIWKYMIWFHKDCKRVYVPSRSTLEHLQEKGIKSIEIWGRGVDLTRFHPRDRVTALYAELGLDSSRFMYLFVGRLAPEKSVEIAIEAFERLPERIQSRSQLVIAGDGPLYKEFTQQHEKSEHIRFIGFVQGEQLAELYSAADVFVFPSATETFGNVVLEAMASGTAVVGADAGGVRDNIIDGITGLLCTPGATKEFTAALISLYDNEQLRTQLTEAGVAYAAKQSWNGIFSRLYASYHEVVKPPRMFEIGGNMAQIQ